MSNKTYQFDENFLRRLLAFLIRDKTFYEKNFHLIEEGYFQDDRFCQDIFRLSKEYIETYKAPIPEDVLRQKLTEMYRQQRKDNMKIDVYFDVVTVLYQEDLSAGREYSEDEIAQFAKNIRMMDVLVKGKEMIRDKKPVDQIIEETMVDLGNIQAIGATPDAKEEAEDQLIKTFPDYAVKGWIKDFADLYSQYLESPYPFWVFTAATCLGAMFCKRIKLKTQLYVEPRLYVICVGPPGSTRKSEAGKQAEKLFEMWLEPFNLDESTLTCTEKSVPNPFLNFKHGFGSAEGLMRLLKPGRPILIMYDELRSFVMKCVAKGSNLLNMVNSLFEDTQAENITKEATAHETVEDAHLSLCGFCTDETWNILFTSEFLSIGFVTRLWIVPGAGSKKNFLPTLIPKLEVSKLKLGLKRIYDMIEAAPKEEDGRIMMEFDQDALELGEAYYLYENPDDADIRNTDILARLDTYQLRLLMIMALSEKTTRITRDMVYRSIALMEWQKNVRRVYQPEEYQTMLAKIQGVMKKTIERYPGISWKSLLSRIRAARKWDTEILNKAMDGLIKSRQVVAKGFKIPRGDGWLRKEPKYEFEHCKFWLKKKS